MTQSEKSKSGFSIFWLLIPFLFLLTFACMAIVANFYITRMNYSQPGEPRNAWLVHMAESGGLFRNQTLCTGSDCLLLKVPGMTGKDIFFLEVNGKKYSRTEKTFNAEQIATGVYCPGEIDLSMCLLVTVSGNVCPKDVVYFRIDAPLVVDSCLVR